MELNHSLHAYQACTLPAELWAFLQNLWYNLNIFLIYD